MDSVKLKLKNPQITEQSRENREELVAENRQQPIPDTSEQNIGNLNSKEYDDYQKEKYKKENLNLDSCIIVRYPPPMWRKYYFPKWYIIN